MLNRMVALQPNFVLSFTQYYIISDTDSEHYVCQSLWLTEFVSLVVCTCIRCGLQFSVHIARSDREQDPFHVVCSGDLYLSVHVKFKMLFSQMSCYSVANIYIKDKGL